MVIMMTSLWRFSLILCFIVMSFITSPIFSNSLVDPEEEFYYKLFIGFFHNHFVVGASAHIVLDTSLYLDTSFRLLPFTVFSNDRQPIYFFNTSLQSGSFGYKHEWFKNKFVPYQHTLFVETLEY